MVSVNSTGELPISGLKPGHQEHDDQDPTLTFCTSYVHNDRAICVISVTYSSLHISRSKIYEHCIEDCP